MAVRLSTVGMTAEQCETVLPPTSTAGRWLRAALFERPLWVLVVVAVAANAAVVGIAPVPIVDRLVAIARSPFAPPVRDDFLLASPINPLLAHTLGITTRTGVIVLAFVVTIVLSGLGTWLVRRWHSDMAARLVTIAWASSPLMAIELTWLGIYDPWTRLCATVLVVGPRWACAAAALILGFNHFEQGVFIGVAAIGLRSLGSTTVRMSIGTSVAIILGVVAGRLALAGYLSVADAAPDRIAYIGDRGPRRYVEAWAGNPFGIVYSIHALLWVPFVAMLIALDRTSRRRLVLLQIASAPSNPHRPRHHASRSDAVVADRCLRCGLVERADGFAGFRDQVGTASVRRRTDRAPGDLLGLENLHLELGLGARTPVKRVPP